MNKFLLCFLFIATKLSATDMIFRSSFEFFDNEDSISQDFLTPNYYYSEQGDSFRYDLNKFIYFVRLQQFTHPLSTSSNVPSFNIPANGEFGARKGQNGIYQHHTATDIHVGNNETLVDLYAVHDGYVTTYRDAEKYRQYLSIELDIHDNLGAILGKLVTIYAHIDLDLDEAGSLIMNQQFVQKGDLISKNLYSQTVGGPHLHFEIRYYKNNEISTDSFYGLSMNPSYTEPSAGIWLYGLWNPNIGYGFADPKNHGLIFY